VLEGGLGDSLKLRLALTVTIWKESRLASILVEIPHAISRYSDDRNEVRLDGATVGEVLSALWKRFPNLKSRVLDRAGNFHPYLLLFQNDQKLPRSSFTNHPVSEGDRLEIVALAEGG
jgi:hypothetical protein